MITDESKLQARRVIREAKYKDTNWPPIGSVLIPAQRLTFYLTKDLLANSKMAGGGGVIKSVVPNLRSLVILTSQR